MSNLLDRSSLVLTPTAYNNGEALCIKPDDGSGDFQFSRNSAATRVNAQGLVENVQILSSNLVQNGDFSEEGAEEVSNGSFSQESSELITNGNFENGNTGWANSNTNGYSVSNGKLNLLDVAYTKSTLQLNVTTVGKIYKVTYEVSDYVQGSFRLVLGGTILPTIVANGVYTNYVTATSATYVTIQAFSGTPTTLSIDNVSVREVGQDWTLTDGCSIVEQGLRIVSDGTIEDIFQSNVVTGGKTYEIEYEITESVSGSLKIVGTFGANLSIDSTVGVHKFYGVAVDPNLNIRRDSSPTDITITNISVKEVAQNWTLGTGVSIGSNEAVFTSTPSGQSVGQSAVAAALPNGALAKVSFEVLTRTEGTFGIYFSGTLVGTLASAGVFTGYFTKGTETSFYIRALGTTSGTISNVNVIQITDDTNLPRINYENFSYQDALGSEEVVNGDFATDSNWTKGTGWTISGGLLNASSVSSNCFQSSSFILGKTYKVTYSISNYVSGLFRVTIGSSGFGQNRSSNGTFTENIVYSGANFLYLRGSSSFTGSIDNVSVKEYLGQSVVPNSGCGSWLWEPQSTNLFTYSEDFSQWTKSNTDLINTITSTIISPDGVNYANKLYPIGSNPGSYIRQVAAANCFSIFIKKGERRWVLIYGGFANSNVWFNSENGLLGTVKSEATATVENFGNDWYRLKIFWTQNSTQVRIYSTDADNTTQSTGNGTDGVYIWGAQLEQQSYATSYIPTSGSQVTRNQDLCTNASIPALSGSHTVYADYKNYSFISGGSNRDWQDGTNKVYLIYNYGGGLDVYNGSAFIVDRSTLIPATNFKIAIVTTPTTVKVFINGVDRTKNNASPNLLPITKWSNATSPAIVSQGLNSLVFFNEALSDQELADLTYPTPTDPTFTLDFDTIAEQFTFARGSEATYVDAQGLIQSTNELGEELITNGDFATDTDWAKQAGWTISGGTANANMILGGNGNIYQSALVSGKTYELTFTVSNYVQGNIRNVSQASNLWTEYNSNGTFTEIFVANNANLFMNANVSESTQLSIDNVSVKEYITATNTPRLDYSTGAEAFLLEPQSTNLITYSSDFSQNYWSKQNNATVTSNSTTSPNGEIDADLLNCPTTARILNSISVTSGVEYTFSIFIKKGTSSLFGVDLYDGGSNSLIYNFDTNVVSGAITDNSIEDYGNGWHRLSGTITPASTTLSCFIYGNGGYSENEANTYIWGAQVEQQSYATSYIPSNGSQTTRNQETCINATPEINSEQGVLYFEAASFVNSGADRAISLFKDNSNTISVFYYAAINTIRAVILDNGGTKVSLDVVLTDVTDFNKIALKYKENDVALWVNGTERGTDTNCTIPTGLNSVDFKYANSPFFGNTKNLQVYPKALSDAELINLTTI